jgi:hypothetical protein
MSQRFFRTRNAAHTRYFRGGIKFGPQATAVPADHPRIELLLADPHLVEVADSAEREDSNNPQREGDALRSDAKASRSRESTAVGGKPTSEATPEGSTTSGTAGGVPPNADSGSRGEGAGHGSVAPASSAPSRVTKAPAKKAPAKTSKPKA